MNFSFISILLFSFSLFFLGCGVKSDPIPPPGTGIPSYVNQFLETPEKKPGVPVKEQEEKKKNESDNSNGQ